MQENLPELIEPEIVEQMQTMIKEKEKRIEDLEKEVEDLKKENTELKEQIGDADYPIRVAKDMLEKNLSIEQMIYNAFQSNDIKFGKYLLQYLPKEKIDIRSFPFYSLLTGYHIINLELAECLHKKGIDISNCHQVLASAMQCGLVEYCRACNLGIKRRIDYDYYDREITLLNVMIGSAHIEVLENFLAHGSYSRNELFHTGYKCRELICPIAYRWNDQQRVRLLMRYGFRLTTHKDQYWTEYEKIAKEMGLTDY